MQYYLQSIQEFLTTNGYTNVFYDYDNPSEDERIFIQSTGGVKDPSVPNEFRDFAIYIRRNNRASARTDTEVIYTLLDSNSIPDKGIIKIETITPPTIFSIPETGSQSEYLIQFRCLIVDNTKNRI